MKKRTPFILVFMTIIFLTSVMMVQIQFHFDVEQQKVNEWHAKVRRDYENGVRHEFIEIHDTLRFLEYQGRKPGWLDSIVIYNSFPAKKRGAYKGDVGIINVGSLHPVYGSTFGGLYVQVKPLPHWIADPLKLKEYTINKSTGPLYYEVSGFNGDTVESKNIKIRNK